MTPIKTKTVVVQAGIVERYFQNAVSVVLLALMSWVGTTVLDTKERVIRMEERTASLTFQIKDASEDRYRGRDAARDQAIATSERIRIDARVDDIDKRVSTIERGRR